MSEVPLYTVEIRGERPRAISREGSHTTLAIHLRIWHAVLDFESDLGFDVHQEHAKNASSHAKKMHTRKKSQEGAQAGERYLYQGYLAH